MTFCFGFLLFGKVISKVICTISLIKKPAALIDKADLEQLIDENDVINRSAKLPGLIIQSYLVLVELFELDPMEPLHRVKVEEIEEIEARDSFSIDFYRHRYN